MLRNKNTDDDLYPAMEIGSPTDKLVCVGISRYAFITVPHPPGRNSCVCVYTELFIDSNPCYLSVK